MWVEEWHNCMIKWDCGYSPNKTTITSSQRDSTTDKVLALNAANQDFIPGIPHDVPRTTKSDT